MRGFLKIVTWMIIGAILSWSLNIMFYTADDNAFMKTARYQYFWYMSDEKLLRYASFQDCKLEDADADLRRRTSTYKFGYCYYSIGKEQHVFSVAMNGKAGVEYTN